MTHKWKWFQNWKHTFPKSGHSWAHFFSESPHVTKDNMGNLQTRRSTPNIKYWGFSTLKYPVLNFSLKIHLNFTTSDQRKILTRDCIETTFYNLSFIDIIFHKIMQNTGRKQKNNHTNISTFFSQNQCCKASGQWNLMPEKTCWSSGLSSGIMLASGVNRQLLYFYNARHKKLSLLYWFTFKQAIQGWFLPVDQSQCVNSRTRSILWP